MVFIDLSLQVNLECATSVLFARLQNTISVRLLIFPTRFRCSIVFYLLIRLVCRVRVFQVCHFHFLKHHTFLNTLESDSSEYEYGSYHYFFITACE